MSELLVWTLSLFFGGILGIFFYGGLWWTVQQIVVAAHAELYLVVSLLLRSGVTVAGFYLVSGGQLERMLLCFIGFIAARFLVTRITAATDGASRHTVGEVNDAS